MKNTVLKYGLYSAGTILILFVIAYFFLEGLSFGMQEVIGYLSMFIALSFVFFGVKSYRDEKLNGKIGFGRALGTGMLIVLVPALIFGLYNAFYMSYLAPDFAEQYYAQAILDAQANLSGAELTAKLAEIEEMKAFGSSIFLSSLLMFATVLILGFIVSLITAATLRKG